MITYYNSIDNIQKCDTVIIPIGSVEQHGSHLPTGTDYFIIKHLSEAVAEKYEAYLLPPLPISTCYEHKGKKGSVCMSPIVFYQMLQSIILNLKDQGFKKVIVLFGHGGVFAAAPAIRELNALNDGLQVIKMDLYTNDRIRALLEDPANELHAGDKETSLMLYLEEKTVDKKKMKENDCIPDCPREYLNYSSLVKLSDTGVWGRPSYASKEKGKQLFELMVEEALRYIKDAFSYTETGRW